MDSEIPLDPAKKGHGHGRRPCAGKPTGPLRKIVLTGGPGAGKTAIVNLARQHFCCHLQVLRESASILFSGGFPRERGIVELRAAQRAIYHVQSELEIIGEVQADSAVVLCDRGTLDGLAYWPGARDAFFDQVGTTLAIEYARYDAVLHLRTPREKFYDRSNGVRTESAEEARRIDEHIAEVWSGHSNVTTINSSEDFLHKASRALSIIAGYLPAPCRISTGLQGQDMTSGSPE